MASEEVKIVVKADGSQAVQELDRVNGAKNRAVATPAPGARPLGGMVTPSPNMNAKPAPDAKETRAAVIRRLEAEATKAQTDLGLAKAERRPAEEQEMLSGRFRETRLAARFMRTQGLGEEDALDQAGALVAAQTAAKGLAAEEKAAAKAKIEAERNATRELKEQETVQKRMGALTLRLGGAVASAGMAGMEQLLVYRSEMEGVGLRDTAARAGNQRQLGIMSGWRGTSTEAQNAQFAAEDRVFERKQNRPVLEHKIKQDTLSSTLNGAAIGAGIGSMIAPGIGTAIGAAIGGAGGFFKGRMAGNVALADDDAAMARDKKEREDKKALAAKKFNEEEGGEYLDQIRQRSKRTISGQREAYKDQVKMDWRQEWHKLKNMGATDDQAAEGAGLKAETAMRDQQIGAASGLVDARSGAGDIAAAAQWGQMLMPNMNELKQEFAAMRVAYSKGGDQAYEAATREPFGKL